MGAALFERIDGRFADVPRRVEIRFADAEGDDFFLLRHDVEELADAGFGNIADMIRDLFFEIHGEWWGGGVVCRRRICG